MMIKSTDKNTVRYIKQARYSFFVMALILMFSLIAQLITKSDFKGFPFLLFGIGVLMSLIVLVFRVINRRH